nr:hypothetical protein [Kofleriaceae bacterium]
MTVGELALLLTFDVKGLGAATKALEHVRASAMALSAIRFGESIIAGAAAAGAHIAQLSASTGLSTSTIQEWGYVAEQAGGSSASFARGVAQMDRFLREFVAGRGSKSFRSAMGEVGLSVEDAKSALASPDGLDHALLKISDRFMAMGNTADRAALAAQLFGARTGREIAADLARGGNAIQLMRDHFRELGGELSGPQIAALRGLKGSLVDVEAAAKGLAYKGIAALAPILEAVLNGVAELAAAISTYVVPAIEYLTDHWVIAAAAGASLVVAFAAVRASSIAAAAGIMLDWIAAAAPFILLGVAAVAVGLIVDDLWTGLEGGHSVLFDLGKSFEDWAKVTHPVLYATIETVKDLVGWIKQAVEYVQQLSDGIATLVDKISGIKGLGDHLRNLNPGGVGGSILGPYKVLYDLASGDDSSDGGEAVPTEKLQKMSQRDRLAWAFAHPDAKGETGAPLFHEIQDGQGAFSEGLAGVEQMRGPHGIQQNNTNHFTVTLPAGAAMTPTEVARALRHEFDAHTATLAASTPGAGGKVRR